MDRPTTAIEQATAANFARLPPDIRIRDAQERKSELLAAVQDTCITH